MLRILIVDDEKFEREGIKFLIDKHKINLLVDEAGSGEQALEHMKKYSTDILFTDVKMIGMDGLELAQKANQLNPSLKVIFMSAYGEFEYAQRAIDLKAIRYILKPVQINEFLKVISNVIQLCNKETEAKMKQDEWQKYYQKGIKYEKRFQLSQLIHNKQASLTDNPMMFVTSTINIAEDEHFRIMMLDSKERFFDLMDTDFEKGINRLFHWKHDVVHLNEFQMVVFIKSSIEKTKSDLKEAGEKLIHWVRDTYDHEIYIIFSGLIPNSQSISSEYHEIEEIVESKFFYDQGTVFFTNSVPLQHDDLVSVDQILVDIKRYIESGLYSLVHSKFLLIVESARERQSLSHLYIKYICAEITKSLYDSFPQKEMEKFNFHLDKIYNSNNINELGKYITNLINQCEEMNEKSHEPNFHIIEDVIRIIEGGYNQDLSLEVIAKSVYLSPSYLSQLFKKQTGISFVKYLTSYRLQKAEQQLKQTNKKIIDISEEVGYTNFSYFCSLFKNHFGKTPSQYRREK